MSTAPTRIKIITSCYDNARVLFECEAPQGMDSDLQVRYALEKAVEARADMTGAYAARLLDAAINNLDAAALARAMQWGSLYDAASRLIAAIGYHGERSTRDSEVLCLQECLRVLDNGEHMPGLMPALNNLDAARSTP